MERERLEAQHADTTMRISSAARVPEHRGTASTVHDLRAGKTPKTKGMILGAVDNWGGTSGVSSQIDIGVCYGKTVGSIHAAVQQHAQAKIACACPSCSWLPRGIEHGEGCMQVGNEYIAGLVLFARELSRFERDSVEACRIMVRRQMEKLVSALGGACSQAPQRLSGSFQNLAPGVRLEETSVDPASGTRVGS